jgi:hypothetical protein
MQALRIQDLTAKAITSAFRGGHADVEPLQFCATQIEKERYLEDIQYIYPPLKLLQSFTIVINYCLHMGHRLHHIQCHLIRNDDLF